MYRLVDDTVRRGSFFQNDPRNGYAVLLPQIVPGAIRQTGLRGYYERIAGGHQFQLVGRETVGQYPLDMVPFLPVSDEGDLLQSLPLPSPHRERHRVEIRTLGVDAVYVAR